MPALLVRDLDDSLIQALKQRAARNRPSAEDEHRAILAAIAAIALVHDLAVVTRNTPHFAHTGVRLLSPFS